MMLLKPEETAKIFKISKRTLPTLERAGLKFIRLPMTRGKRYDEGDIQEFILKNKKVRV